MSTVSHCAAAISHLLKVKPTYTLWRCGIPLIGYQLYWNLNSPTKQDEFLPSYGCVYITVLMHHMAAYEMHGEKAKWKLNKNATCCFEWILEAVPHKIAFVAVLTYLPNYPSKMNKTCGVQLERQGWTSKRRSPVDSYTWKPQYWLTSSMWTRDVVLRTYFTILMWNISHYFTYILMRIFFVFQIIFLASFTFFLFIIMYFIYSIYLCLQPNRIWHKIFFYSGGFSWGEGCARVSTHAQLNFTGA